MTSLPAPLVPAEIDLRDAPLPREMFARLGVEQFGLSLKEARALVDEIADGLEALETARQLSCYGEGKRR